MHYLTMDEHAGACLTKNLEARDKVHSCTKSKFFIFFGILSIFNTYIEKWKKVLKHKK